MELTRAHDMAVELMHQHGLSDWGFRFDRATRRFGCCHLTEKYISLSYKITQLNSEEDVRDTVLHEIAHALTPVMGHGPAWQKKCVEIGANPNRCFGEEISTPKLAWIGTCPVCGITVHKARKPMRKSWHRNCGNIFKLMVWKRQGEL